MPISLANPGVQICKNILMKTVDLTQYFFFFCFNQIDPTSLSKLFSLLESNLEILQNVNQKQKFSDIYGIISKTNQYEKRSYTKKMEKSLR